METSFDTLFRQFYAPMVLYADSRLNDREQAEDVVQDVFSKLLETGFSTGDPAKARQYLFTVLRNKVIDIFRYNQRHQRGELCDAPSDDSVEDSLFEQAPANINDIYAAYCNVTPGREIPAQIQALYDHYKTMVPGVKAVNFDFYDQNGKKFTLANLKGKALYIDCWATWCGPCKAETPNMVKLYEHFKGDKRIQLVSISLDKNQAAWKSMVKKENLSWPQYIVKGEFNCMLCKEYGVTGIPRFMMFDKKGNIISLDAPRPSAPNIIEWIESNLK